MKGVFAMKIRPYLTFNGNCAEAVDLYQKAFGVELSGGIMRFGDIPQNPAAPPLTDEQKNYVLQTALDFKTGLIRMSDTMQKIDGKPNEFVSIGFEGPEEQVKHAFETLSVSGIAKTPLDKTFFSSAYGEVVDKFGIEWKLAAMPE